MRRVLALLLPAAALAVSTGCPRPAPPVIEGRIVPGAPALVAGPGGAMLHVSADSFAAPAGVRLQYAAIERPDLIGGAYAITATARPRAGARLTLALPYDRARLPTGTRESDLSACALYDGRIAAPVRSRVDPSRQVVLIDDPELTAPATAVAFRCARRTAAQAVSPGIAVWHAIVRSRLTPPSAPEVLELPGHVFRVILLRPAPSEFAHHVATTLQKIYELYNAAYTADDGTPGLARLSPDRRMPVYLRDHAANGEYGPCSLLGTITIDIASGLRRRDELDATLHHEMFHAVQDSYSNMVLGGLAAMWWYEATAEWAGLVGAGRSFAKAAESEIALYPEVLSVPIRQTRDYRSGLLSYGASLLVGHVESQSPGHLRGTLQSWAISSDALYERMVRDGRLAETYPDFVRAALVGALPKQPWVQARLYEMENESRLFTRPTGAIGDPLQEMSCASTERERSRERRFAFAAGPLTARFFLVHSAALREARSVDVRLTEDGRPSDRAWLVETSGGAPRTCLRLGPGGTRLAGLGRESDAVWIAVFNSDPWSERRFDVSISIRKQGGWRIRSNESAGVPYSFALEPAGPVPADIAKSLAGRWARMTVDAAGRAYASYGRFSKDAVASFAWPEPALPGGSHGWRASVRLLGEEATLEGTVQVAGPRDRQRLDEAQAKVTEFRRKPDGALNRARLAVAWLSLGDRHREHGELAAAREAWQAALALDRERERPVKERLAAACWMEADLRGYLAQIGESENEYANIRFERMACRAVSWMDDLPLGWSLVRKRDESLRRQGVSHGPWVGFPRAGEDILR